MRLADAFAKVLPPEAFHGPEPELVLGGEQNVIPADLGSSADSTRPYVRASGPPAKINKPILQLSANPITINPTRFENPHSNTNPNGDMRTLYAFSSLVDPIPNFYRYYSPSGSSIETTYSLIVKSANAVAGDTFGQSLIATAVQRLDQYGFQNMDGTVGQWYPAYAQPEDWFDTTQTDRFRDLVIDLNKQGGVESPFKILNGDDQLMLRIDKSAPQVLDENSRLNSVSLRYMSVEIQRPWLMMDIFKSSSWFIGHEEKGFCSSGQADDNSGSFPLLPTHVLVAIDVKVDVSMSFSDQKKLNAASAQKLQTSIGPFALNSNVMQIIGFVSALVPFSPSRSNGV